MAYGRPALVRSHRRGGKRRKRVSRSLRATVITLVVVAGLVAGYTQLLASTCSGEETVRMLVSPATANQLSVFATEWNGREPATRAQVPSRVAVQGRDSAQTAAQLAAEWDVSEEQPPEVWVPAASAWAFQAAATEAGAALVPDLLPSIARTPAVIAMPEPMATQLGWPDTRLASDTELRWESLTERFGAARQGWERFDRPEWGELRVGMGNPARDTAGLLALTAIIDPAADGDTTTEELENAFDLSRAIEPDLYHETTEQLLIGLAEADRSGGEAALAHVSAFPALEQEVVAYNRGTPEVPLVAVYPVDGTVEADHPYLVLDGDWVTDRKREVAEAFLSYLRSDGPQAVLREAGFRGTNREPGAALVPGNGVVPELVALPREALAPESVTLAIDRWTALTQRQNVLLAFDVSDSMLLAVPGTGELRLDRVKAAGADVVDLFAGDDQVGFWEYATARDGDLDYRSVVPMGLLEDIMDDGRTRAEQVSSAIDQMVAGGGSGLYNTVQAAYDTVLANYDPDASNLVVVLTDGPDDTVGRPGISLPDLVDHLREAPADGQLVRVATVALGEEADLAALAELSEVTGGETYHSVDGADLADLLRAAIFSTAPA